ncbi:MAG: hypothetical protein MUF64_01680 [Polyangiaceae bacterium]|nr:hypothetical protein [Polyangiaceae bacterium]
MRARRADTSSEVLDLGPEPLELGGTRLEKPVLFAHCLGKPVVALGTLEADGRPSPTALEFEKTAR